MPEAADVAVPTLELTAVLRRLPVLDTYRANIFRLTGIPTDAAPALVRRRREEALLAARLGTPLPGGGAGGPALDPPPGEHALKAAFEAMHDPVQRIVHEMFWLWGEDGPHDGAVLAHCAVLESPEPSDGQWRAALAAWAAALADPGFWAQVERRAKDLDDPRVSPAIVAGLRAVLPQRVIAISAELAVAAAAAGRPLAAAGHLDALRSSPFPPDLVRTGLRAALRGAETRLHGEAEAAARVAAENPEAAAGAASDLIARARPHLQVLTTVLGPEDPLVAALHDEIANTVTRCGVAHYNATERAADALELLGAAAGLARESTTAAFVERNRQTLADGAVLAVIAPWCEAGDVDGGADLLRVWRGQTPDAALREHLGRLLADPRAVRAAPDDGPSRRQYLGCGVRPFGHRARAADDTWIETRAVTVFGAPVFPLGAYLSDDDFVYAKVPMSMWARWAQVLVLGIAAVMVAAVAFGPGIAALGAAALAAALAALQYSRRRQMRAWLAERTP